MEESGRQNPKREKEILLETKSDRAVDDTTHDSSQMPIILRRFMDSIIYGCNSLNYILRPQSGVSM